MTGGRIDVRVIDSTGQPQKTSRVGVIGGGQLAWMLGSAATALGLELVVQTPGDDDPAVSIAAQTISAPIADAAATAQLAASCDVITFENEFVDLAALSQLAEQGVCFRPSLSALAPLLDKYHQRLYLSQLGLPVPAFSLVETSVETLTTPEGTPSKGQQQTPCTLYPLPSTLHPPCVVKARRHGYDGQGTWVIRDAETWIRVSRELADVDLLVEELVPFERELAVIAARSITGEVQVYPVVETQQVHQVCRRVIVPAPIAEEVCQVAIVLADRLLTALGVVGVFAIELFLTADGNVLVNEVAPRVHNSGHFSLDACATSQFEQHLRAVCGLPLGNPALKPDCAGAVMVNLLGYEVAPADYRAKRQALAALPNAHVYWYGKAESRPGRKLGHVTVVIPQSTAGDRSGAEMAASIQHIITQVESIWYAHPR